MTEEEKQFVAGLYQEMYNTLKWYAQAYISNTELSKDAIQTTFEIACEKASILMKHPNPQGWIRETFKNVLKKQSSWITQSNSLILKMSGYVSEESVDIIDELDTDLLYANIADKEDYIFVREFEEAGRTVEEFAKMKGMTRDACNKRLQRARHKLRKYFEKG